MATERAPNVGSRKPQPGHEKPLSQAIRERRSTPHFESTPIPDADLKQILQAGLEAPSGYNLQPWRFVVVTDAEQRKKLKEAAMGQPRIEEAPVVVVACGDPLGWKNGDLEAMLRLGQERGHPASGSDGARNAVSGLLGGKGGEAAGISGNTHVWVNRHVMIAFTTLMWMAECLGYDTAPMEGFWEDKVKQVLNIPPEVRVVALLAIGKRKGNDKMHGRRFPSTKLVFENQWGNGVKI